MKNLQTVLEKYEKNRQKIISSLELNEAKVAQQLLEDYVEFSYMTILDNTTKAQVAFTQNAKELLEIEQKELTQLEDFKRIKEILIKEREEFEDKNVVLDAITIKKQQYLFDLKNLEDTSKEKKESLDEYQTRLREGWSEDMEVLNEKILLWKEKREQQLSKASEERLYDHTLKISQIEDAHKETVEKLTREQELKSNAITKDISIQRKELTANQKDYNDAKEYAQNFETNLSEKVAKQIKIKLGFIKQDHTNSMNNEKNVFSNQLDILDLKIENIVKNSDEKRVSITELKEKLANAKAELNQLTQSTLSV